MIAAMFHDGVAKMQRERFVHQLHTMFIRLNEDMASVIRPTLIELGARHRIYGINMRAFEFLDAAMMETLEEMLGRTHWRAENSDAWAYVLSVVVHYFQVGWTFGIRLLNEKTEKIIERKTSHSTQMQLSAIRNLREKSKDQYDRFFESFAAAMKVGHGDPETAAKRYRDGISRMLDEPDKTLVLDRISGLGRRHRVYHGVNDVEVLCQAALKWMSTASAVFGKAFTNDVALEWALLWENIAVSMRPEYKTSLKGPSVTSLVTPYLPKTSSISLKPEPVTITLKKKTPCQQETALLQFIASEPIRHLAGQFVKLRWNLNGKSVNRYYSVASCPDPVEGVSRELQFLVKRVPSGRLSPYLVDVSAHSVLPSNCYEW